VLLLVRNHTGVLVHSMVSVIIYSRRHHIDSIATVAYGAHIAAADSAAAAAVQAYAVLLGSASAQPGALQDEASAQ
jgi:hypothetical protein